MIEPSSALPMQAAMDTVLAVMPRDTLAMSTDVAILLMALGVVVLSLLGIVVLRRVDRTLQALRRQVSRSLAPVSDRARSISDNVEFITEALRTDVHRLNDSVKALSDRLHQASDRMEERIEEFNALMEVVQGEAEGIFLDTAATVRGVREGARAMAGQEEPDASMDSDTPERKAAELAQGADRSAAPGSVPRPAGVTSRGSEEPDPAPER